MTLVTWERDEQGSFEATDAGGDDRGDQGRGLQDGSRREPRSGAAAQFLRELQNSTEQGVDPCGRNVLSLKDGVGQRPWLQAVKSSRLAGWMTRSRRSRHVVEDFANTRDPTVFAAASDTAVGIVVECKAVFQNYSVFTFDVTSAFSQAWEDELVFVEPPQEELEMVDCLWRSVMVMYGRRKGARSWQGHFDATVGSDEATRPSAIFASRTA